MKLPKKTRKTRRTRKPRKSRKSRKIKYQIGGLDPILRLPCSLFYLNYENIKYNQDGTVEIINPEEPLFNEQYKNAPSYCISSPSTASVLQLPQPETGRDDSFPPLPPSEDSIDAPTQNSTPFVLDINRRDWIGTFYPYSPYIINLVTSIDWSSFNEIYTIDDLTFNISLGNKEIDLVPYYFFGGCVMELYNIEIQDHCKNNNKPPPPNLHDYVPPTADIDVNVRFSVTILSNSNLTDIPLIQNIELIRPQLEFDMLTKFYKHIENKVEDLIKILGIQLNFVKKDISPTSSPVSESDSKIDLKLESDRIRINATIFKNNSDHLLEFIPTFYYNIESKIYSDVNDENKFSETSPADINNCFKSQKGYFMRNIFSEHSRLSQLVNIKKKSDLYGNKSMILLKVKDYDKDYCRLRRLEYIYKIIIYMVDAGLTDYLNEIINKEGLNDVFFLLKKPKPTFIVDLNVKLNTPNFTKTPFYRDFNTKNFFDSLDETTKQFVIDNA